MSIAPWEPMGSVPLDGSTFVRLGILTTVAVGLPPVTSPDVTWLRNSWIGYPRPGEFGCWRFADHDCSFGGHPTDPRQAWMSPADYAAFWSGCQPWRSAPRDHLVVFFRPGSSPWDAQVYGWVGNEQQHPVIGWCNGPRAEFCKLGRGDIVVAERYLDEHREMRWCEFADFVPQWVLGQRTPVAS